MNGDAATLGTATDVQPPKTWSRAQWIIGIGIAFAAHVGLIFAFGNRTPIVPRAVVNAPSVQLSSGRTELQSLDDPTLFALPHARGFAASSWRPRPRIEFAPFRWTESPQLMALPVAELGNAFVRYSQSNAVARLEFETLPPAQLTRVEGSARTTTLKQQSSVRVSPRLANRRWLNQPAVLASFPAPDLLTNSVVRVVVEPEGQVFSPVLMPPGSGSKAADQLALELARAARFAPLPLETGELTVGALVFEWHTVPLPVTNAPSVKP